MAKRQENRFELFRRTLTEGERSILDTYFLNYRRHVLLGRHETRLLYEDAENAILTLSEKGIPLSAALERLDAIHLGGFYARPSAVWYPLDDAAKIYPLSMKHGQMAMFRLSACLDEPILPAILQMALSFTIKRFPFFATTVKKGFFWHYLDSSKRRYGIEKEQGLPCRPMTVGHSGEPSFRVLYWQNRISVEYFHILTDGTGGMVFLKTLVGEYLRILGTTFSYGECMTDPDGTPSQDEVSNQFPQVERKGKASGFRNKTALQMGGKLSRRKPCRIIQFQMPADKVKEKAREAGTTVTGYMLSKMFLAMRRATDETEGLFNIQIPVNMRKFRPSRTMRNFAMYCGIQATPSEIDDGMTLVKRINGQLETKASKESMDEMARSTERIVRGVRYVPLAIKRPIASVIYGFLGDKGFSSTLSNLGVVTFPPEVGCHVKSMDFILGTAVTHRAGCSLVTVGNAMTLSMEKLTADPSFEEALYEFLRMDDIPVQAEGSELYAD